MAVIPPWTEPPNFLAAMQGGASLGLEQRGQDIQQGEAAARLALEQQAQAGQESEAAQRLQLSYNQLAQEQKLAEEENKAKQAQAAATLLQHYDALNSLNQYRQSEESNRQEQLKLATDKATAAQELERAKAADTMAFFNDVNTGVDPVKSLQDHPKAAGPEVNRVVSDALTSKRQGKKPERIGEVEHKDENTGEITRKYIYGSAADALQSNSDSPAATPTKKYSSADEVRAAVKRGDLTKDEAKKILQSQFGFK